MSTCLGPSQWSLLIVSTLLVGCAYFHGEAQKHRRGADPWEWLHSARVVDLTYPLGSRTIFWPTSLPFSLEVVFRGRTEDGYWYAAHNIRMAEHGGTHMDAPFHFGEGKAATDAVPLRSCMGPAVVIDVREQAASNPDYQLSISDILDWEARYGPVPRGAIVVLFSGWGSKWGDRKAYLGSDRPGDATQLRFPGFSPEAMQFLLEKRDIAAIGVDTASIDPGFSRDFPVHRILAAANKPAFENLANVEVLPPSGAFLIALPLKIEGGSGGPARVIAFLPD